MIAPWRQEGQGLLISRIIKKPKELKDNSDGCIDTWVEVMRLHLEQDNLNDDRQACRAILDTKQPRGNSTELCGGKDGGGECHCRQDLRDTVESIWIGFEGPSGDDDVLKKKTKR